MERYEVEQIVDQRADKLRWEMESRMDDIERQLSNRIHDQESEIKKLQDAVRTLNMWRRFLI